MRYALACQLLLALCPALVYAGGTIAMPLEDARTTLADMLEVLAAPAAIDTMEAAADKVDKRLPKDATPRQRAEARVETVNPIADRLTRAVRRRNPMLKTFDDSGLTEHLALIEETGKAHGDVDVRIGMARFRALISGMPPPAGTLKGMPQHLTAEQAKQLLSEVREVLSAPEVPPLFKRARQMHKRAEQGTQKSSAGKDQPRDVPNKAEKLLLAVKPLADRLTYPLARKHGFAGFTEMMSACADTWKKDKEPAVARGLAAVQDLLSGQPAKADTVGRVPELDDLADGYDAADAAEQQRRLASVERFMAQGEEQRRQGEVYAAAMRLITPGTTAAEAFGDELVGLAHKTRAITADHPGTADAEQRAELLELTKRSNVLSVFLRKGDLAALQKKARPPVGSNDEL
eukprot:TRINITY_DN70361_c0_g1_i1.p1 TRINITY_DN70361_c0_g1~~TRINITY_DN70361_c0_g1_i1.p1  ORF type:complete len:431 (+),score=111.13 TRINITY_DN70361_c0_g1_i1:84-1295(+)